MVEGFGKSQKAIIFVAYGGLAQLARALAWHARGHQFDPGILHKEGCVIQPFFVCSSFCWYKPQDLIYLFCLTLICGDITAWGYQDLAL